MRALLGAPIWRDRGAAPRQAHDLKVGRATRAPAAGLAVALDKGYFSHSIVMTRRGSHPLSLIPGTSLAVV